MDDATLVRITAHSRPGAREAKGSGAAKDWSHTHTDSNKKQREENDK